MNRPKRNGPTSSNMNAKSRIQRAPVWRREAAHSERSAMGSFTAGFGGDGSWTGDASTGNVPEPADCGDAKTASSIDKRSEIAATTVGLYLAAGRYPRL